MGQLNYQKDRDTRYLKQVSEQLEKVKEREGDSFDKDDYVETWIADELPKDIEKIEKRFKTLNPEEASRDMEGIISIGHQEICILSGEAISVDVVAVADYVRRALDIPGIKEVILNMGAYTEKQFADIKNQLIIPPGVKLQHRIFQETYNKKDYDYYMKRGPDEDSYKAFGEGIKGKKNWKFRYDSQIAALKAGFDEVGIGALFGLRKHPLKDIKGLQDHAEQIKNAKDENGNNIGKEPKRCCLPFANNPEVECPVDVKFIVPGLKDEQKIIELIYALARLAMPTVSIVSSERDNPEILKKLDQYANHTTLFVHPEPGENIHSLQELAGVEDKDRVKPVGQAEVVSRRPAEALADWQKRGYNIIGFDVDKYQNQISNH